jgi:hypothetical protein
MIDTLSAGLSVMVRHAWLLILPIAFDLFLWLAPPLAMGGALHKLAFPPINLNSVLVGAPDPELATQLQTTYDTLSTQISQTNFWGWAIPSGLFFPSVMVGVNQSGTDVFWALETPFAFFGAFVGLTLFGILVNVIWLHTVAYATTHNPALLRVTAILQSFIRLLGLGLLLLLILLGAFVVTFIFASVIALILPGAATVIATLIMLVGVWWAVWIGVQLYFTIASLVVGGKGIIGAPNSSLFLLRRHPDNPYWRSCYGFICITVILSWGFIFIWQSLMGNSIGRVVSIVGNAALGTGVTAAMMLFYHQRTADQPTEEKSVTI